MSKHTYTLHMRDDGGSDGTREIEAETLAEAIDAVQAEAEDWCSGVDWGTDGASVGISWTLRDEVVADGYLTVEIEPDHKSLIREAMRHKQSCGDDPDDHDWTSEGEGGCTENPGVWSTGGTSMVFSSHCRNCGLHRTEYHTGSQKNPGEHDTVEYEWIGADDEDGE